MEENQQGATNPDDLTGLTPAAARDYVIAHIATFKLNARKLAELDAAIATWTRRLELARSASRVDLEEAATAELARQTSARDALAAETDALCADIERMKRQLGGLASRERSIDPDLLEQELLMATGHNPGDEASVDAERKLSRLEKEAGADAALAALKAKMDGSAP